MYTRCAPGQACTRQGAPIRAIRQGMHHLGYTAGYMHHLGYTPLEGHPWARRLLRVIPGLDASQKMTPGLYASQKMTPGLYASLMYIPGLDASLMYIPGLDASQKPREASGPVSGREGHEKAGFYLGSCFRVKTVKSG